MSFQPMLASPADLEKLTFPLFASPKLDGIRAVVRDGRLLTRKLKLVPNRFIQQQLGVARLQGLDGELIVGSPTSKTCYLDTSSGVMSHDGEPDYTFRVFDLWDDGGGFGHRIRSLKNWDFAHTRIVQHEHVKVADLDELLAYETAKLNEGYEGLILRSLDGPYKFGRSTAREGWMLKLKRFEDSEAEIIGIVEEMHNTNEAAKDELGRTKRSKAQAGLVGKGTMGALKVRDIHHGWEFEIGTGFTAAQRAQAWKLGSIVKYKFFPIGMKDVPRHPVYLGPRSKLDL